MKQQLEAKVVQQSGVHVLIQPVSLPDADSLKNIAFQLKGQFASLFMVLAAEIKGNPQVAVMLSDDLVAKGLHAGNMVKELAKHIQGGGGGQPFYATAGGKDAAGLNKVIQVAQEMAQKL